MAISTFFLVRLPRCALNDKSVGLMNQTPTDKSNIYLKKNVGLMNQTPTDESSIYLKKNVGLMNQTPTDEI